ncbi:MAG TPA: alpha/beta hydrolase [Salinisphaeraceae bacterium]|nr:alpha/beta hydrolase [Salinisphaeraceae bacterium]
MKTTILTSAFLSLLLATGMVFGESPPEQISLQDRFDPLGADVHTITANDRAIYYIDVGPEDGTPVVFLGGSGTSLEAFQLTEFARTSREALGLRMISVERNGAGATAFDPSRGYADYNDEIVAVMDHLGVDEFSVAAISGGGAFAAHLAADYPERIKSLHLAAATASQLPDYQPALCDMSKGKRQSLSEQYTQDVTQWWGVSDASPVQAIAGWQDRAYSDGLRSFYFNQNKDPAAALTYEYQLICNPDTAVDPTAITAPAYLYYGAEDKAVDPADFGEWQSTLPNVVSATLYPGIGHTVQYRHWVQLMADIAGYDDYTVVCRAGKSQLVANEKVQDNEQLGLCAWTD